MPLDQAERNNLSRRISEVITNEFGYTGPANAELLSRYADRRMGQPHADHGAPLGAVVGEAPRYVESGFLIAAETLLLRLDNMLALVTNLLEGAIGQVKPEQPDQPDKPKNRGGRPPKQKPEAAPAAGAVQTDAGFPRPDKGGNGAGADELFPTEGGDAAGGEDDPLGIPGEKPEAPKPQPSQPPQQQLTDVQVKDALRTYMQAYGNEGTARLTDLLTRVAGVKRFSDLPANKWGAVVTAAQQEVAGKH